MELDRAAAANELVAESSTSLSSERDARISSERNPDLYQTSGAVDATTRITRDSAAIEPTSDVETRDLPTGADKSGVTSQSISVPKGSGSIKGMEESFSAQLSTGIATFSVPFALPAARGGAQPSLGLSYSSSGGLGVAGLGWSVGVPFIARQTDRGIPKYNDASGFHADQDRFVFNGGQELVPICVVGPGLTCAGALSGEKMPPWSEGAMYFRPRVEGSFLRFFWSPNKLTWRVQDKSGVTMELGVPLDGSNDTRALERNPDRTSEIYRWHLVRQYDTYGEPNPASASANPAPFNVVVYRYIQDGGTAYLSEIFDTTPAAAPATTDVSRYAHHTRLVYETRTDPTFSYRSGWRMDQKLRLKRVDVASKTFNDGESGNRRLVRRYHLGYESGHVSLLASVQVEGRCASSESAAPAESNGVLPEATGCPRLPAMKFSYGKVTPLTTSGGPGVADLPGYEGFDERIRNLAGDPPHSVDEALTDLFDVNSDGLPDVLVTAPGTYGNGHGVFFNSAGGTLDQFGTAEQMGVQGVLGANANTIKLSNLNLAALDATGDGTIDLLHMPRVKTYSIYEPKLAGQKWSWVGRVIDTASGQSPKIDFGRDTLDTRIADVNFDGLVDVVVSTGTEFQTFFSLGRYPRGDGQFGSAVRSGPQASNISNDPVRACVPHAGTPVRFSDGETQLGDMNGDGIVDIVRVQRGNIRYWPGRGNGFWGTGKRDDCPGGTFGANRYIAMASSPSYSDIQGTTLRLDDVNGDGLDDLVQVNFRSVDVYLNVDGVGWTKRHVIANTPASPSYALRVRLVDVNGSGTRDLLWGDGGDYKYIDLQGGKKPGLLVRVENGLGKSTDIEYSTSTEEMLAAERTGVSCDALGNPWGSKWCTTMPTVAHVVKRVTERDNLVVAGKTGVYVTEYSYRDPVYDGRQREFRGFQKARSRRLGDANSPTDITESTFLLGECEDETPGQCADLSGDNPKEALKGLPVVTEKFNESGVYLSTELTTYRLRRLYVGIDGREVRHAFASKTKSYVYDTAAGPQSFATQPPFVAVELETAPDPAFDPEARPLPLPAFIQNDKSVPFRLRGPSGYAAIRSESVVDFFGNRVAAIAHGCAAGSACPTTAPGIVPDEIIYSYTLPVLPTGEETGWLWRTGRSYVIGSQVAGSDHRIARNDTATSYDEKGAPTTVHAALNGTVALDRFYDDSPIQPIASPPGTASNDGPAVLISTSFYDELGNVMKVTGANGRCRTVGYEATIAGYAQFPTTETIHLDGSCEDTGLTTAAIHDRGFGLLVRAVDLTGQTTSVKYDGFGRLTELRRPKPSGGEPTQPSTRIEYFLPDELGTAYSLVHTETEDGEAVDDGEYLESWSYVDGLGRTRLTLSEADPTPAGGDGGAWIVSDAVEYDAKGAVHKKRLPFFTSVAPETYPLATGFPSPAACQTYDAFGRGVLTIDLDAQGQDCTGTVTLEVRYHALSKDLYDASDRNVSSFHHETYASETVDGHGRTIVVTERIRGPSAIRARDIRTQYLPTGEPEAITRVNVGLTDPPVTRWMRYDSLGRMVLNVDPHTSVNFTSNLDAVVGTGAGQLKAWRYAYNDAGDLVGTSDARGCGVNFHYDNAGRIIGEDYSPCTEAQHNWHAYTVPNASTGAGFEVLYYYDAMPADTPSGFTTPPANYNGASDNLQGRLAAVFDRAQTTWNTYDARGRVVRTDKRLRKLQGTIQFPPLATYYWPRWYTRDFAYDAADREVAATTGSTVTALQGVAVSDYGFPSARNKSVVTTQYSRRGTVMSVGGSYGELVSSVKRTADGLIDEIKYGDAAATTTDQSYDQRRRLEQLLTFRQEPDLWASPPNDYQPPPSSGGSLPTFQFTLQHYAYAYDEVNNPTAIQDLRPPEEWPDGAKPVDRAMQYDSLNRLTRIDYTYKPEPNDIWISPHHADHGGPEDPRRALPEPEHTFTNRVRWQTYSYNWVGSITHSDDDSDGYFARSMGLITHGTTQPYRFIANSHSTGKHLNEILYDNAGNLVWLRVNRQGVPCVPAGSLNCYQRNRYTYDEVGRLVLVRRIGFGGAVAPPEVLSWYDANDQRTMKWVHLADGSWRVTAYIFDSLELRRAGAGGGDYILDEDTEVVYLNANGVRLGRVVVEQPADGEPRIADNRQHVFLNIGDHLGSTNVIVDKETSELVEFSTYQAYGAAESDYRPDRWKNFREDYRFTGKEEDIEVGLIYFGKRFYSPYLNRFVSPDPLAVHVPGAADLNLYAYVSGQALKATDPLGLCGNNGTGGRCSGGGTAGTDSQTSRSEEEAAVAAAEDARRRAEDAEREAAYQAGFARGEHEGIAEFHDNVRETYGLKPPPDKGPTREDALIKCGTACERYKDEFEAGIEDGSAVGYKKAETLTNIGLTPLNGAPRVVVAPKRTAQPKRATPQKAPEPGRKIPKDQLIAPPSKRGNAPTGSDGHPVELHHRGQQPDSPIDELTRTDHRGKGNFTKNHSNTGQSPSEIDRQQWKKQQKDYWKKEWDDGRFEDL